MQRPCKYKEEERSHGKKNCGKTVNFDGNTQEVNTMVSHNAPIPGGGEGESRPKILRVIRIFQYPYRSNALMVLTA